MARPNVAVLGSHSALDVCLGAKQEGLRTIVICQKGREQTYATYYKTRQKLGCVDECLIIPKFSDVLSPSIQKILQEKNSIFVPHRSFEVYCNFDYEAIEKRFLVPIFGNKFLLKIEERGKKPNQYDLLTAARIRFPKAFTNPKDIDRLSFVKVLEKDRPWERAFFLVTSYADFVQKSQVLIKNNKITKEALGQAVIEEFILGTPVNFNFFYSPLHKRLELLGTDTRRQTNLEGILRLPGKYQEEVLNGTEVTYEEAGHIAVTVLESLLEQAFIMGEAFVQASLALFPPGVIGPFALQTIVTSGPPKKDIVVIDVSPRMPGSPGITATPYSTYLFRKPISTGERVAMEIKEAVSTNTLSQIVT